MTLAVHRGRAWVLPADVDTDQLAPGATMKHGLDVTAQHCLEALRPDFARAVRRGDVVVAGANFGIGSSREQAASVLVHLGVAAVVAPAFAGLYFRNAFNVGLLLLTCPDAERIGDGELIAVDEITVLPSGMRLPYPAQAPHALGSSVAPASSNWRITPSRSACCASRKLAGASISCT